MSEPQRKGLMWALQELQKGKGGGSTATETEQRELGPSRSLLEEVERSLAGKDSD